jgi:hypothetical protein
MPETNSIPTPVKTDSRVCFAIKWFTTKADANTYGAMVRRQGQTYNGGFMHGMSCGRDTSWDYVDADIGPLFGVTTA